jgi:hypothetical protein
LWFELLRRVLLGKKQGFVVEYLKGVEEENESLGLERVERFVAAAIVIVLTKTGYEEQRRSI